MTWGNNKLPKYIATFNFCSAHYCPALALGICKHANSCYGLEMEIRWTNTELFHIKQGRFFDLLSKEQLAELLLMEIQLHRLETKKFRFSVVGDLKGQKEVDKFTYVAGAIRDSGIVVYGYTAMEHLDFTELMKVATVNGSYFMLSNKVVVVDEFSGTADVECPNDCAICEACMESNGKVIEIIKTQNKRRKRK